MERLRRCHILGAGEDNFPKLSCLPRDRLRDGAAIVARLPGRESGGGAGVVPVRLIPGPKNGGRLCHRFPILKAETFPCARQTRPSGGEIRFGGDEEIGHRRRRGPGQRTATADEDERRRNGSPASLAEGGPAKCGPPNGALTAPTAIVPACHRSSVARSRSDPGRWSRMRRRFRAGDRAFDRGPLGVEMRRARRSTPAPPADRARPRRARCSPAACLSRRAASRHWPKTPAASGEACSAGLSGRMVTEAAEVRRPEAGGQIRNTHAVFFGP